MPRPSSVNRGRFPTPSRKPFDRLEEAGIISKVSYSSWAAPIVPVPKKDGKFRICGDYKVTVNPVLEVDTYPLPKPQDLFATLAGGQKFTKLDFNIPSVSAVTGGRLLQEVCSNKYS